MSQSVKIKGDVLRALAAAVAAGTLPQGCHFGGSVKDRTLCIEVQAAPFNCLKDSAITGRGSYEIKIGATGEDSSYTPECEALDAKVKEIAVAVVARRLRFYVGHSTEWIKRQMVAKRAA